MKYPKDISGMKFGRLTVIERATDFVSKRGNKSSAYLCKCECGKYVVVRTSDLKDGTTKSCGCLRKEMMSGKQFVHGKRHERIYSIYSDMKKRCYNSKYKEFYLYGGRGIKICDEWIGEHGFENFYEWSLENGYSPNLSIDRINTNKGYSPENCRWTDNITQANNRRNSIRVYYNHQYMTISELSKRTGYTYGGIYDMIKRGKIKSIKPNECRAKEEMLKFPEERQLSIFDMDGVIND